MDAQDVAKSMDDAHSPSLAQVWQLPLLAVSLGLFGVGLFLAAPRDPVPAFSAELDAVTALVSAGQYAPAVDRLESLGGDLEGLPAQVVGRYFLAKADALYLARNSKTSPKAIKPRTIAAAYRAAEKNGQKLTPPRLGRLADVLVAMEQIDEALVVLARVPTGDSPLRQQILKRIIAVVPHEPGGEGRLVRRLIDDLMAEPEISDHNRVWAVAQDAERLLSDGRVTDAVDFLLRRITTLANDGIKAVGPLLVLLGEAYLREGDPRHAEQSLMQAQALLPPTDGQQARILVALGQIRLAEGNAIEAHEHFEQVVSGFSQASALPRALIGRAEANARRGAVGEALADYDRVVQQIRSGRWPEAGLDASLHASLQHQHDLRYGQGDFAGAVKFLQLRSRLAADDLPPTVLRQLADTHEQIARSELGMTDLQADPAKIWSGVEKVKRIRALHHFEIAARFYRRHARAVSRRDDEAFSLSLWKSGVLFDLTGKTEQAIEVFNQYVEGRPSDPRRLEATFRLAQAEQAAGRFDRAVQFYDRLLTENPKSPEAYASLVPLARCYLAKGAKFVDTAEDVLRRVVENHAALRPESREYRQALIELGQLYYHRGSEGDYERAIARLSEVVGRYGDDPGLPALLFKLGDAYRKSVEQIDKKLAAALPPSKKAALETERASRLDQAQQGFEAVILAYEKTDATKLDELQSLYLRNSYFYRADAAYELGQFEGGDGAIALYEQARQRYPKHPASLVALVQIANSYGELDQWDNARAANARARVFLQQIPEDAFTDPNLPMDRRHWQRWLDWSNQLAVTDVEPPPAP